MNKVGRPPNQPKVSKESEELAILRDGIQKYVEKYFLDKKPSIVRDAIEENKDQIAKILNRTIQQRLVAVTLDVVNKLEGRYAGNQFKIEINLPKT